MRSLGRSVRGASTAGSAALEYVGALAAVSLVVGLLTVAVTDTGPVVAAEARAAVCRIVGAESVGCAEPAASSTQAEVDHSERSGAEHAAAGHTEPTEASLFRRRLTETDPGTGGVSVQSLSGPGGSAAFATLGEAATTPDGDTTLDWCGDPETRTSDLGGGSRLETELALCADETGTVRRCIRGREYTPGFFFGGSFGDWAVRDCLAAEQTLAASLDCAEEAFEGAAVVCQVPAAEYRVVVCTATYRDPGGRPEADACTDTAHDPQTEQGIAYPGESGACTSTVSQSNLIGWERACVASSGALYHCTVERDGSYSGAQPPPDAPWSCDSRTVPRSLLGQDGCTTVGEQSALCTVANTSLRCFEPSGGRWQGSLLHCRTPERDDPLAEPAVVAAVADGLDPEAVVTTPDCQTAVGLTPEALAETEARHGPVPDDTADLVTELDQELDGLAEFVLGATGLDPRLPGDRVRLDQAYLDIERLAENQRDTSTLPEASPALAAADTGQAGQLQSGPGRTLQADSLCAFVTRQIGIAAISSAGSAVLLSLLSDSQAIVAVGSVGVAAVVLAQAINATYERRGQLSARAGTAAVAALRLQYTELLRVVETLTDRVATLELAAMEQVEAGATTSGGLAAAREQIRLLGQQLEERAGTGSVFADWRTWFTTLFGPHGD